MPGFRGRLPRRAACFVAMLVVVIGWAVIPSVASAQGPAPLDEEAALAELAQPPQAADPAASDAPVDQPSGIDLITLFKRGGALMWPIGLMSLLVVTLAVERLVSFRRRRMLPPRLVRQLNQLIRDGGGGMDAEAAFRACRDNRSVASRVITAMLMRTGRPLGEIEQAANETAQREADDQAGPIRWLNLAAAATPLMGLLGTVWGMIIAFHESSTLTADRSRSEQLSEGIYTALVTTLAGLAVAIPAAIMAQYLENRLSKIFHRIETLAFAIAPSLEHYAGRMRMDADGSLRPMLNGSVTPPPSVAPPPSATPPPAAYRPADSEGRSRRGGETAAPQR